MIEVVTLLGHRNQQTVDPYEKPRSANSSLKPDFDLLARNAVIADDVREMPSIMANVRQPLSRRCEAGGHINVTYYIPDYYIIRQYCSWRKIF